MKNVVSKLACLLLTLCSGTGFLLPVHAQVTDETIERVIERLKPIDYDYYVGTKVGSSLSRQCAVLDGNIIETDASKITFSVEEKLFGENFDKNVIQLNYKKPFLKPGSAAVSTWAYVDVKKGNRLMVFYCQEADRVQEGQYTYITSDRNLFSSIKESVQFYIDYKQKPEVLLKAPNLVKTRPDRVLLGCITELLSKGRAAKNPDDSILVISQLFETDKIPAKYLSFIESVLVQSLIGSEFYPITSETRNKSVKTLVGVASSNKKLAGEVIRMLVQVFGKSMIDLRPYLNQKNKVQILKNLRILPKERISQKEREEFEKLLN